MILTGAKIRELRIISPHEPRTTVPLDGGCTASFGESFAGYDIRLDQGHTMVPGRTVLASSVEEFTMPGNVLGVVHDKSTWARRGLAVQNTVIEPGWRGFLTLELVWTPVLNWKQKLTWLFGREQKLVLEKSWPIAQVVFHEIAGTAHYDGKYQNQRRGPQGAL